MHKSSIIFYKRTYFIYLLIVACISTLLTTRLTVFQEVMRIYAGKAENGKKITETILRKIDYNPIILSYSHNMYTYRYSYIDVIVMRLNNYSDNNIMD